MMQSSHPRQQVDSDVEDTALLLQPSLETTTSRQSMLTLMSTG